MCVFVKVCEDGCDRLKTGDELRRILDAERNRYNVQFCSIFLSLFFFGWFFQESEQKKLNAPKMSSRHITDWTAMTRTIRAPTIQILHGIYFIGHTFFTFIYVYSITPTLRIIYIVDFIFYGILIFLFYRFKIYYLFSLVDFGIESWFFFL